MFRPHGAFGEAYLKFLSKFFQQLSQSLEFFRDKMLLGSELKVKGLFETTLFLHP